MSKHKVRNVVGIICIVLVAFGIWAYQDFKQFCVTSVPIFAYHRVEEKTDLYSMPPEDFKKQMAYLKEKGYKTLKLGDYAQRRKKGDTFHNECVLIFDDGYEDNLTIAAPIMKEFGYIGNMYMAGMYEGWPGYLTWDQEVELAKWGWELGSHTFIHKPMTTLEPAERLADLKLSHDHMLGLYYSNNGVTLSYPNGACNDAVAEDVKRAGYVAAVTGKIGVNTDADPLLQLRRVNVFHLKDKNLEHFKKGLLKAQLISWFYQKTGYDMNQFLIWYYSKKEK
jgi:peptidoglycan/xylan/chitin deacetylase (PgdA/CDA1 family)